MTAKKKTGLKAENVQVSHLGPRTSEEQDLWDDVVRAMVSRVCDGTLAVAAANQVIAGRRARRVEP